MNIHELKKILDGEYIHHDPKSKIITLDGYFTVEQLKIIIKFLENQE